ncbi:hypothetical protein ABEF93_002515 [Exophiala dermatitidis]
MALMLSWWMLNATAGLMLIAFLARLHAYKWRLKQWGIGKYFKDAELEEAAKEAKRLSDLGQEPPEQMQINGRTIPWDRVRRKFRRERKETWAKYDCAFLRRAGRAPRISVQTLILRYGPLESEIEGILIQISTYFPDYLVAGSRPAKSPFPAARANSRVDAMKSVLDEGLAFFEYEQPEAGWPMLHNACDQVKDALCEEDVSLLPTLISMLCEARWQKYKDLYAQFVSFYHSMAQSVLGPKHPVTTTLSIWAKVDQPWDSSEPIYRLILDIIDTAQAEQPTNLDTGVLYTLQNEYITHLTRQSGVTVARSVAESKWHERQQTLGANDPYTIVMLHKWSMLIFQERQFLVDDEVETIWKEILRQGDEEYLAIGKSFRYVYAVQIGLNYFRQERYAEAESCYSRAALWVETMVDKVGSFHIPIQRQLRALQGMRELGLFDPFPPDWIRDARQDILGELDELELELEESSEG